MTFSRQSPFKSLRVIDLAAIAAGFITAIFVLAELASPNTERTNAEWETSVYFRTNSAEFAALTPAKRAILRNESDVSILFIGDSTSIPKWGWVYRFAQLLSTLYPRHSVYYYMWDSAADGYAKPLKMQTGSGPYSIKVFNASASGSNFNSWMGSRFANAVGALSPNLIVINVGLNVASYKDQVLQRRSFLDGIQQILTEKPGTPIAMHLQQPLTDSDLMSTVIAAQRQVKSLMPGVSLIDSYSRVVAAGRPAAWYVDNTHFSRIGAGVALDVAKRAWLAGFTDLPAESFEPWIQTARSHDLLINGGFTDNSGVLSHWDLSGDGTIGLDLTDRYPGKPSSVKFTSRVPEYISQEFTAEQLAQVAGKVLTVIARVKIAPGGDQSAGLIFVRTASPSEGYFSTQSFHTIPGEGSGAFNIHIVDDIKVPEDADAVEIRIYASTSAISEGINIDEIHCYIDVDASSPPP